MDRRQFGLGALAFGLGAGAARAEAPAAPAGLVAEVLKDSKAPALAGLVINRQGVVYLQAEGVRRNGAPDKVTTADIWHLGSNTKAMTAAVYGRLVEQGKARWGATMPELFPDLTVHAGWKSTTIEAIMAHRAGLLDAGLTGAEWAQMLATPKPVAQERTDLVAKALAVAPAGPAGAFSYANADYILAGAAIERIAHKPWEDVIQAQLWAPLGLTTAGFGAPKGAQPWGHAPAFFGSATPGPRPVNPDEEGADNPPALGPAGTAHMAMADYARWLGLFLNDGGGVLKPETVRTLTTPVGAGPPAYALGWGVLDGPRGHGLTHAGSNTYWYVNALVLPQRGVAIAVASNDAAADGGQKACQQLGKRLADIYAPPITG